jgi:hypothetical protein
MAKILIDMTNRNKRHITGTSLCHYCRDDLFPHGKIIVHSDKLARRTSKGDWKCGVCLREDFEKTTKLMNRQKDLT